MLEALCAWRFSCYLVGQFFFFFNLKLKNKFVCPVKYGFKGSKNGGLVLILLVSFFYLKLKNTCFMLASHSFWHILF